MFGFAPLGVYPLGADQNSGAGHVGHATAIEEDDLASGLGIAFVYFEEDDTGAGSAHVLIRGAATAIEEDDTGSGVGHLVITGRATGLEEDDTASGAAAVYWGPGAKQWSDAWAEAQASVPANIVELYTLELLHPAIVDANGLPVAVRAVRDTQDHVLTLEANAPMNAEEAVTFTAIPFEVPWPEQEQGRTPELTIRIDNIGREIVPYLDTAVRMQAPLTVIFRVYLYDTTTGVASRGTSPITFPLRSVTVSESYVEGSASPADLANLRALRLCYDLETFPALDILG